MPDAYGRSTRAALSAADPVPTGPIPDLPKPEARSLLGQLGKTTYQQIDNLFYGLDTPGAVIRSGLYSAVTGRPAPDALDGWDKRVEGAELLDAMGVTRRRPRTTAERVARTVGGLGVEIVTDPLSILSGPAKALTLAGRAADAAGVLKYAQKAASTAPDTLNSAKAIAAGRAPLTELPAVGKMTTAALTKAGVPITEATVSARPLVGPRLAARRSNIDEVLAAVPQSDRQRALDAVNQFLASKGKTIADVRNLPLAKSLGVGMPLGDAAASFDVLGKRGGDLLAGAMDAAGHAVAWSPVGRVVGSAVQKAVNGTIGLADQVHALRANQLREAAESVASRKSARAVSRTMLHDVRSGLLRNGATNLISEQGNDAILKLMETPRQYWSAADHALYQGDSMARELVDNWDSQRQWFLNESKRLGLDHHALVDPYGTQYVPRQLNEMHLLDGGGANPNTRGEAFMVPGGTRTLRALSIDPQVAGLGRALKTDDLAADYIERQIQQMFPGVSYKREHAVEVARALRNIPDETVAKRMPWFSDHPLESISRYMTSKHKQFATAEAKIEALADFASQAHRQMPYTQVHLGGHVTASDALTSVGLKSTLDNTGAIVDGAGMRLKEEIAKRLGTSAASVDLANVSIPQELIARLNRAMDIYQSPELQRQISGFLDQITKIWKAGVLTWPARYVRDLYSGFVSNLIETGDGVGCVSAYLASRKLISGDYRGFAGYLATIPKYSQLSKSNPGKALEEFLTDVGSTGIFGSSVVQDIATANMHGMTAASSIPGANPLGVFRGMSELLPSKGRTWTDFFTVKGTDLDQVARYVGGGKRQVRGRTALETKNPWFKAGEHFSEYTDSLNRMTGMLTLMKNNIDPVAAAERIKRAQVDYGSLTTFERVLMTKVLFPFWAYQSRMGHYVVNQILSRPGGRYAQMLRGLHDAQNYEGDRYVPTNIREQYGLRLSGDERGDTYLTDIDLPGVDLLNLVKPGGTRPIDVRRTLMGVAQNANPLIRGAVEVATGENMFHKRPLHEVESGLDRVVMALGGPKLPTGVNTLLSVAPVYPRIDSVLRAATEKNRTPGERALDIAVNNFLGVKRRYVPKETEERDAIDKIRDELHEQGRVSPNWYVPREDLGRLTPSQMRLYQLYRMLDKHSKARSKARREGEPLPPLPF